MFSFLFFSFSFVVLKIQPHSDNTRTSTTVQDHRIRNAINYRLGILPTLFPHLQWYSKEAKDYKYSILAECPEVLLKIESEETRTEFKRACKMKNKQDSKRK